MTADSLYCMELLEQTGIVVVPGSGFGQAPGNLPVPAHTHTRTHTYTHTHKHTHTHTHTNYLLLYHYIIQALCISDSQYFPPSTRSQMYVSQ
jgi:hypothetical protein